MKQVSFAGGNSGSPDTPEWHAWRKEGLGGSDGPVVGYFAKLNSKASWMKGLSELWLVKTGQIVLPYMSNWATQRGKDGEEPAREAFERATGIILSPIFGEMDDYPFVHSSFDGVDFFHTIIGEIKCPGTVAHENARKGIIPDYYFTQMLHQGLTLWGDPVKGGWVGKRMFYISYVPETGDLVWVEVPCDDIAIEAKASQLLLAEIEFWKHVSDGTEPAGNAWIDAANDYIESNLQLELAKSNHEMAKARVQAQMGDRLEVDGAGVSAKIGEREGLVSYKDTTEVLMKWYGIEPSEFLPNYRGEKKPSFTVSIKKTSTKKGKGSKAEGALSLEAARAELARIAAIEATAGSAAFAW